MAIAIVLLVRVRVAARTIIRRRSLVRGLVGEPIHQVVASPGKLGWVYSCPLAGERTYRVPSLTVPDTTQQVSPEMLSSYEGARLFVRASQALVSGLRDYDKQRGGHSVSLLPAGRRSVGDRAGCCSPRIDVGEGTERAPRSTVCLANRQPGGGAAPRSSRLAGRNPTASGRGGLVCPRRRDSQLRVTRLYLRKTSDR